MWRKIRIEDIHRGTVVRLTNMLDTGAFADATIIAINSIEGEVTLARPMAYANRHYDSKMPLLTTEIFGISMERMLSIGSDVQVWDNGRGEIRRFVT